MRELIVDISAGIYMACLFVLSIFTVCGLGLSVFLWWESIPQTINWSRVAWVFGGLLTTAAVSFVICRLISEEK